MRRQPPRTPAPHVRPAAGAAVGAAAARSDKPAPAPAPTAGAAAGGKCLTMADVLLRELPGIQLSPVFRRIYSEPKLQASEGGGVRGVRGAAG